MKRVQFKNSLDIFVRHLQGKVPNEGLYTETLFFGRGQGPDYTTVEFIEEYFESTIKEVLSEYNLELVSYTIDNGVYLTVKKL